MKDLNSITTEMMEHICDNLCWYPEEVSDKEELERICAECKMGQFVCDIINPGKSNFDRLANVDSMANLMLDGNIEGFGDAACLWIESKHNGICIYGEDGPGDTKDCKACYKAWLQEEAVD